MVSYMHLLRSPRAAIPAPIRAIGVNVANDVGSPVLASVFEEPEFEPDETVVPLDVPLDFVVVLGVLVVVLVVVLELVGSFSKVTYTVTSAPGISNELSMIGTSSTPRALNVGCPAAYPSSG